jgi:hypothetical protein
MKPHSSLISSASWQGGAALPERPANPGSLPVRGEGSMPSRMGNVTTCEECHGSGIARSRLRSAPATLASVKSGTRCRMTFAPAAMARVVADEKRA